MRKITGPQGSPAPVKNMLGNSAWGGRTQGDPVYSRLPCWPWAPLSRPLGALPKEGGILSNVQFPFYLIVDWTKCPPAGWTNLSTWHKTICTHIPAWLTEVRVNTNHNDGQRGKVEEARWMSALERGLFTPVLKNKNPELRLPHYDFFNICF